MEEKSEQARRATKAEIQRAINERLDAQCGRINWDQLREIGLSPRRIGTRARSGELILESKPKHPNARGPKGGRQPRRRNDMRFRVYRSPGAPDTPDGARWAATLSAPGTGWLDHISCLQLHGLESPTGHNLHVVVEGPGWLAPRGVTEHRTRSLPPQDRTHVRGIQCTAVPRALIAAAEDVGDVRLDDLLDTAVRRDAYDGDAMIELLERHQKVPGYAPLVAAVARLDSTSGTFRSIFERRTMRLMQRSQRLPSAVVNELLEGFRPDLHLPGTRVIIECDGRDYHRSPAQIIADDRRQEILESLGYVFLRLRWHQVVYEEAQTLRRIERFVLDNLEPPTPNAVRAVA